MRKRDNLKYDISGLMVNLSLAVVSRLPHRTVYTDVLQQAIERQPLQAKYLQQRFQNN